MWNPGSNKKAVTALETLTIAIDSENTRAAVDEIQLVLVMRMLRINFNWRIQFHRHGAMRKALFETLAHRPALGSFAGYLV